LLISRIVGKLTRPFLSYAIIELAIGVLGILSPFLLEFLYGFYLNFAFGIIDIRLVWLLRVTCGILALLPSTILMGMTLPLGVKALT
jgi:hypothetical protein